MSEKPNMQVEDLKAAYTTALSEQKAFFPPEADPPPVDKIPACLAGALQRRRAPVDLLGVRGSDTTPARLNLLQRISSDSKHLGGKKLVIWCFAAREFTESQGWRKVPLVK